MKNTCLLCVVIPMVVCSLAMFGWVTGNVWLTSWSDNTLVTQKTTTSLLMFSCCLIRLFIGKNDILESAAVTLSVFVVVVSTTVALSWINNNDVFFRNLVAIESSAAAMTTSPGRPSFCTLLAFVFLSIGSVLELSTRSWVSRAVHAAPSFTAAVALLGYLFGQPTMYCWWEGRSSALAIPTAICFFFLGAAGWMRFDSKNPAHTETVGP